MKEREYDSSKYEWKFKINDQPWGWNCDIDSAIYYTPKPLGPAKNISKKAIIIFNNGTSETFDSMNQLAIKYGIIVQTIYSKLSKDIFYNLSRLDAIIKYVDDEYSSVKYRSDRNKWIIRVRDGKRSKQVGQYSTREEAMKAFDEYRMKHEV